MDVDTDAESSSNDLDELESNDVFYDTSLPAQHSVSIIKLKVFFRC